MIKNRAQEEIVGFAMIIILVAIILLVFLGLSLSKNKSQNIDSYEAESFLQSMLQYTTSCQDNFGYLSVKDLLFSCDSGSNCQDGNYSCDILDSTLQEAMNQSWPVEPGSPIKGYSLNITSSPNARSLVQIKEGNDTVNSIGTTQDFAKGAESINVLLRIYS